ncbi:peptidase C65 Otubain-domain-containing protein [Pholiota molesta]|nr:peptidase C65 Otubain-domain-containing protein [Pholiota molesta]
MNQELYNDSVPARALIESVAPMTELRSEYENGSIAFVKQIDWLMDKGFKFVRRTRGDGDCFYRSIGFAYIDNLLSLPHSERDTAVAIALSLLDTTPSILDNAGIEKLVYEDYYDVFKELVEKVSTGMTAEVLLETFQNAEYSNSVVLYLRLLTSAQIRLNRSNYDGFLVHPDTKELMDVDSFTSNVVQAMGKEADNVEIDALSNALKLNLDLAYLNGVAQDGHVDFIQFRNDLDVNKQALVLLYRPGHYDILVRDSV